MSRIGKKIITLPKDVTVSLSESSVVVKGKKHTLTAPLVEFVDLDVKDDVVQVFQTAFAKRDSKRARSNHGLMRALLNNMVIGVSKGFTKKLIVDGVGYKADVRGKKLVLNLGYSHPIEFPFPAGIDIKVEPGKNLMVIVSGPNKEKVGQAAAEIRGFRKPDHYKGKGVRYETEIVRLKAGKR
jgi:large subunit ribosomal protein L6